MSFHVHEFLGAFPVVGPVTYLKMSPAEVRAALAGPYPAESVWFHATSYEAAISAIHCGLIPSCWWGLDSCCVFGCNRLDDVPAYRRAGWILEVHSAALDNQLKAWWVPAAAIHGVWHEGVFHDRADFRSQAPRLPVVKETCCCDLAELTAIEIAAWRRLQTSS